MLPMRRAKIKRAGKSERGAENAAIAGADFMLSIVEAHHTRGNGNVIKMDSGLKAQQELTKIEEQITRLEALEGQNAETLRQIKQLHERVKDLRREISSHLNAWERTELARHPQRPYTLDYVERIFTDWSEIHGDRGFRDDLAIVVADRVLMMENSVYSVISPEGCASIMWRDPSKKALAAEAMKITAKDLSELGCIDAIIPEPPGGAHTDHARAAELLDAALQQHLAAVKRMPVGELLEARYQKFRNMAQFFQVEA